MEENLPRKLDTEILKQLATEQVVEMIIEEGESIEKLTNRVVELEEEIEKLKVSRDLDSIRLWKAPPGDILKKTENKQHRETRREPDTKTETRRTTRP
jgi:transposase